jgi:hypothetical protein
VKSGVDLISKDVQTGPFTIKRIPGVNEYKIKVLSKNTCGTGKASEEITVIYYDPPT